MKELYYICDNNDCQKTTSEMLISKTIKHCPSQEEKNCKEKEWIFKLNIESEILLCVCGQKNTWFTVRENAWRGRLLF